MIKFPLKFRLSLLNFLEFAIWGAYLTSLGNFLAGNGLASQIGWFYAVQGIVSIFMPSIIGIIADRYVQAQKMLSFCQLIGGLFMGAAGFYCMGAETIEFAPLFTLYTISVAFFMPTIGLNNSVAFNALTKAGEDTVKAFPPIRIWGTIGFICAMLFVNFAGPKEARFQTSYYQLFTSAFLSLLMASYALTMPKCPTSKAAKSASLADQLGLRAFALFKQKKMAIFFIFSMFLGVSLQITNGYANPYITSFIDIPAFANAWAAKNANALISLSQVSETLCILLIPFCLKRFGIKGVMLMSMVAWVLRFGLFGAGNPEINGGLWMFVLSCIVYGVAFDFFNVSGGLYVDKETNPEIRSSAQGLFMIMTNGLGATIGTLAAMSIVNHYVVPGATPEANLEGWRTCWYIFAGYAAVVAVLFALIFKDNSKGGNASEADVDPAGMVEK
ncbi:MAG: MFS transporter [Muribaculaceae bacterium]|nr:MFS transporter [Muribaculaceae bacterium]MDE7335610.1 MFS transporter [Muribaculaceae bacterium]